MNIRMRLLVASLVVASLGAHPAARGDTGHCGWSRIDREVSLSETGLWKTTTYRAAADVFTIANVAGALWEGSESRLGRTMWQGFESQLIAESIALAAKPAFGRQRPRDAGDPCKWRSGGRSFPSEEATASMALVMPYVLEYGRDNPAAYALLALPAWVGVGRIKNRAHWTTDVLAGWAIGGGSAWFEHAHGGPFSVRLLPGGAFVGFRKSF